MNSSHYTMVAKIIQFIAENRNKQPKLTDISHFIGLSEYHLQRVFTEWVGISPKQFLHYLMKEDIKSKLHQYSVLETTLATGVSSTSRLHDLMITWEGMTPGEYKQSGKGLTIYYGDCESPFGHCFIAVTDRGICNLSFFDSTQQKNEMVLTLQQEWTNATLLHDTNKIKKIGEKIFVKTACQPTFLKLFLKGSPFQIKVWEALLHIPEGKLVSYQEVANAIKAPKAVRAAASAVGKNPISYLIPCHRVIRQTGQFGEYHWNKYRKQAMISYEHFLNLPRG